MRKIVVSFGGVAYDDTIRLMVERAPSLGADDVWIFDDKWLLTTGFKERNLFLFETPPHFGFGYCGWKAFVIQSALDKLQDGDVVFYVDADTFPIGNPFGKVFDACAQEGGVFLFAEQGCSGLHYTKKDCFLAMGVPLMDSEIACGRFSLWQKGSFLPKQILAEWWAYSVNPRCMLWDHSILAPDHPEFAKHCTEQSVLTLLKDKYKLPLHRCPDQNGSVDLDWDLYAQILEQKWCVGDHRDLSGSHYRNI